MSASLFASRKKRVNKDKALAENFQKRLEAMEDELRIRRKADRDINDGGVEPEVRDMRQDPIIKVLPVEDFCKVKTKKGVMKGPVLCSKGIRW